MSQFMTDFRAMAGPLAAEFKGTYPDAKCRMFILRLAEGVVLAMFDQEQSETVPVAVFAVRREDWRHVIDLIPAESISFPGRTWDEFLAIEGAAP